MTKYVKKQIPVEAIRWTGKNTSAVNKWIAEQIHGEQANVAIFVVKKSVSKGIWANVSDENWSEDIAAAIYDFLHETYVGVKEGQWIICGTEGEFYPHDHEPFKRNYEPWVVE